MQEWMWICLSSKVQPVCMFFISHFPPLNNRRLNMAVDLIFHQALFTRTVFTFYLCQNSAGSSLFSRLAAVQKLSSKCKWLGNVTLHHCSIRSLLSFVFNSIESAIKELLSPLRSAGCGYDCSEG